ncbi:MAG: asparagine synthase (glutamine-hydrolyzing) [bacterium]
MCGICGIAGLRNRAVLAKMNQAMIHRGPDEDGFYIDDDISLAMRRLKIIDLATGAQPIHNETRDIWVIFNGEIYNFEELKKDLISKGHSFYTKTDTEVIPHLYEEYKESFLEKLEGMYSIALWDKTKGKLLLARDRVGIKPLYYSIKNGNLYFASEIKPLFAVQDIKKEIDYSSVYNFVDLLYIPAPKSIYKDIHKLLAGHYLVWQNGNISIKQYWDLSCKSIEYPQEDIKNRIKYLLRDSVKKHLMSDVSLGAFLSGGMDSSAIVALMSEYVKKVKTFSIGYQEKYSSYNELKFARCVAERFNTEHHEYILEPKVVDILPALVQTYGEPFADSSSIPTYLISQASSKHVTVALTGIGGDELFAGYPRYLGAKFFLLYKKFPAFIRSILNGIINLLPESTSSANTAGRLKRFTGAGNKEFDKAYIEWMSFVKNRDMLFSKDFNQQLSKGDIFNPLELYFDKSKDVEQLQQLYYVDVKSYLADDLLCMADRMSMAHSLELRVPLLDHRLVELLGSVELGLKTKGLKLKYLFKKIMSDMLPSQIMNRGKLGFMIPLSQWLKDDLQSYIKEFLSEESIKKRGIFNHNYVASMIQRHNSGRGLFTDQLWALLNLELWFRNFSD